MLLKLPMAESAAAVMLTRVVHVCGPASESIDALFLKTETKPVLYYLPLTDEQVRQRKEREQLAIGTGGRAKEPPSQSRKRGRRSKKARDGYRHVRRYDSRF